MMAIGIVITACVLTQLFVRWYVRSIILSFVFLGLLAGCSTPPVSLDTNIPIASQQNPTSQSSQAGDLSVSGNNNTTAGGGNSYKIDGGTAVLLALIILPLGALSYIIGKKSWNIGVAIKTREKRK